MRFLVTALSTAAACSTPCESLRERAQECGGARGRYAGDEQSVCLAVRRDQGATFDAFAACVGESTCSDVDAVARCTSAHVPAAAHAACLRYQLWSAACGLEPAGTADDCAGVEQTAGGVAFDRWVDCVTHDGCPAPDDDRWLRCRDSYLPEQATLVLDACILIDAWTARCAGANNVIPVERITIPECLAQADPFTASSYYAYATCLSTIACDAIAERAECFFELEITDRTRIEDQCAELIAFTETCRSLIAGGTEEVCVRLYARFTPASVDAYSACLRAGPCGDAEVAASCGALLELQ